MLSPFDPCSKPATAYCERRHGARACSTRPPRRRAAGRPRPRPRRGSGAGTYGRRGGTAPGGPGWGPQQGPRRRAAPGRRLPRGRALRALANAPALRQPVLAVRRCRSLQTAARSPCLSHMPVSCKHGTDRALPERTWWRSRLLSVAPWCDISPLLVPKLSLFASDLSHTRLAVSICKRNPALF